MSANRFHCVNQLLAALPESEYQRLLPYLQPVELNGREILYQPQETIRYAYFPEQCLISSVAVLENGATTEVARVGKKGVVGIPSILGRESSLHSAMVLIGGNAMRLEIEILQREFNRGEQLQRLLLLYTHILLAQVMQNVACHSQHKIEQRLARLLLSVHDCLQQDRFALTQESIATMLGVRRAGVTNAANHLQKANIIHYRRGNITIIDRSQLEQASCECYSVIKREFDRLFGF